jgi:hypothetical protein
MVPWEKIRVGDWYETEIGADVRIMAKRQKGIVRVSVRGFRTDYPGEKPQQDSWFPIAELYGDPIRCKSHSHLVSIRNNWRLMDHRERYGK